MILVVHTPSGFWTANVSMVARSHRRARLASRHVASFANRPSSEFATTRGRRAGCRPNAARRPLTVAELVTLAVAAIVGMVALASLASAHLGHATLPIIAVASALVVVVAVLVVWRFDRPKVRLDAPGLIPVVAGLVLAAIMMFPGFEYGTGDRDPGAYIEHAVMISRNALRRVLRRPRRANLPGTGYGGRSHRTTLAGAVGQPGGPPGTIFPQFYHLWPALLATANDIGGFAGLFNTVSLLGVIAVGLAVAVARRIAGLPAAWLTAALLPTNMLEVWQAKYPSAEIFGQMLFMGTMLGVILAIQMGWRTAAAAAGVLLGLSYLERADGIVLVLIGWATLSRYSPLAGSTDGPRGSPVGCSCCSPTASTRPTA